MSTEQISDKPVNVNQITESVENEFNLGGVKDFPWTAMKFLTIPVLQAEGAYLAHSLRTPTGTVRKGQCLTGELVRQLYDEGQEQVTVARLEAGDMHEDEAALAVACTVAGDGVRMGKASTGRVNLHALCDGLCEFDRAAIDRANAVDEGITIATVAPSSDVVKGRLVATVKIIPYAVRSESLQQVLAALTCRLQVYPRHSHKAVLIQTQLSSVKDSVLDKTLQVTRQRLLVQQCRLELEIRVPHTVDSVVAALEQGLQTDAHWLLIAGASAISDREDVIPAAIRQLNGEILHFGMPMDPGNLLMIGTLDDRTIIGMPGCARSAKRNGLDRVLERLACALPVTSRWIASLGVGGLLHEIVDRPHPRGRRSGTSNVTALVLAAGSSKRFGQRNKLLTVRGSQPVLGHVLSAVQHSNVAGALVVTGDDADRISELCRSVWSDTCRPLEQVHNPLHATGMASSLVRGFSELSSRGADGVLVCLGDMPDVSVEVMNQLVAAFVQNPGFALYIPVCNGQRGNPVLIAAALFDSVLVLEGEVGARSLAQAFPDSVLEVPCHSPGVLKDIDTAADL